MRLGRVMLAIAVLAGAGWKLPTRPDGDVAEGNRAFAEGDYQRALAAYRRALEGDGDRSRVHFDIGAALYGLAEAAEGEEALVLYERAESAFRRAAESRDPDLAARAYYNLGNVFVRRARYDDAIRAYRVVLRLDADFDDARHNLEVALRRRDELPPSGQGGPGQPGQMSGQPNAPGGAGQAGQGEGGEPPQPETGEGAGDADAPGGRPTPPSGEPPPEAGAGSGQPGSAAPSSEPAPPRPSSAGDIERKLRALERRSRELRHERLRSGSRDSDAPRLQHGKDW